MTTNRRSQNPFSILRLSTTATNQEVVERVKELKDDTHDNELIKVYSKAVEQIIHHPFQRLVHTAWEIPDTDYAEHDESWDKFASAFRSNPITVNSLQPMADSFIQNYLHPDTLLSLLSPLLKISRPTEQHPLIPDSRVDNDLDYPVSSSELF